MYMVNCWVVFVSALVMDTIGAQVLSNKVIGTVATSCNRSTFHTPVGAPYPTGRLDHEPVWLHDSELRCLNNLSAVLDYCRSVYAANHPQLIDHAVPDPFHLPKAFFPAVALNDSSVLTVYLCLGPPDSPSPSLTLTKPNSEVEKTKFVDGQPTLLPSAHRLPTLIDVHRSYFADRFRNLTNVANANMSRFIKHLVEESKGLAKLYQSDPQLAHYKASQILQLAHKQLQAIWTEQEIEWSDLEQSRHESLVKQLQSEAWSGENEFTYVLQEFHPNLDRVQDALARLLSRLADSVQEEVLHLKAVHSNQPWTLRLEPHANWTSHVTAGLTNLEEVHRVLLQYVRTATVAINTLRSLMAKDAMIHKARASSAARQYKDNLRVSYDKLQHGLSEAQYWLNQAKATLLGNLTDRMHSILAHLNTTFAGDRVNNTHFVGVTNVSVGDWVLGKHHAELAYIDLLITHLLHPYAPPIDLPESDRVDDSLWQPNPGSGLQPGSVDGLDEVAGKSNPLGLQITFAVLLALAAILCVLLVLTVICVAFYHHYHRPLIASHLHQFLAKRGRKLRHILHSSSTLRSPLPIWKVGRQVIVIADHCPGKGTATKFTEAPLLDPAHETEPSNMSDKAVTIRGYMNPICSAPKG
ncbi:hypothetical protein EG68_03474 [Paragonimus skrjabini miyazakii]|uniref:Uncharacterized protein n=1 Tax=Paragonimus skrjabini miyazakii TaxID=59628 RepID=A0A8S9YWR1_9TREM|nr:hypothetical protein EG68_03474 [Paragonimus skrjabini miyazakii]